LCDGRRAVRPRSSSFIIHEIGHLGKWIALDVPPAPGRYFAKYSKQAS
jgi:hypothetical protein